MGSLIIGLLFPVFSLTAASAETIVLKNGEQLDVMDIVPESNVLKVKIAAESKLPYANEWLEIRKKYLTPEQQARYFGSGMGMYLSLTTMRAGANVEYTYYYNGRKVGMRLVDADEITLRHQGSVPSGVYREFYPGDAVMREQAIVENLRNGPSRIYYPDGGLQRETWFVADFSNGTQRLFSSRGNLVSEQRFIRGKREYSKSYGEGGKTTAQLSPLSIAR
ncbi:MAG TPA: hypothetical protein PKI19_11880 [Elusimicrobiales bacterium]|nr:hypothetical protein [Elusimicrobiales bacterium]